ncbi:hypothetical protein STRAU_2850 [Streptomyces aurantiacus JA 4570]|uniref:Uncharacterized protein n=1 Tax=Streptomyces aurantiacus JA 4570 TaxID=1286094 RepID=S3ZKU0_9ACTN|nr:hypothetical protein STRAU_2850 [Streptomyces aurantiacus JA 4570]
MEDPLCGARKRFRGPDVLRARHTPDVGEPTRHLPPEAPPDAVAQIT